MAYTYRPRHNIEAATPQPKASIKANVIPRPERVMRRKTARKQKAPPRRHLLLEWLENRELMAVDLAARFEFANLGGTPVSTLQTGGDYLLRMYVSDIRSAPAGVKQAFFDVSYPTTLMTINGAVDHGTELTGSPMGDTSTPGLIDEVGGRDTNIPPTPASAEELLFSVPFRANNSGTLNVTATPASHLTFFFDTVAGLTQSNISYAGGTIEIVSSGITITPTSGLTTTESGGTATFSAVLQSQPTADVTFGISSSNTSEGTVSISNVTFNSTNWNVPQVITITGADDSIIDGNKQYTIITSAATSADSQYNGFNPSDVTVTNSDNDTALLSISAPTITESNADQTINFTVTLDKAVTGGFTVEFSSAAGSANSNNDYSIVTTSPLTFTGNAGETKTIAVTIKGDQLVEGNETFSITLGNVTPTVPVQASSITTGASATGTILNDDTATLSITAPTITETNTDQTVNFVVTLDRAVAGGFTLAFTTANGSADASDYVVTTASPLTFGGLAGETKNIAVTIKGDTLVELGETFLLTLGAVTPVSPVQANSIVTGASTTGTILNDDSALAIAATDAVRAEGNSGTSPFTFTATRTGALGNAISVNYAVTGSGASIANAVDFGGSFPSGILTFAANEATRILTINVSGDTTIESDEGFTVTLSGASGGTQITTAAASGTILNDDISLSIAASDATKAEGDSGLSNHVFTITRTGLSTGSTTMNYAVTGNGANPANATDFGGALPGGIVTFNAGETTKTLTISVSGDTTVELDESFLVTLSGASGGAQIATATATGIIQNDDAVLNIVATDAAKAEGNNGTVPFTFTITRSGLTTGSTTVNYTITGSGANPANVADFGGTFATGQIIFAANETNKTLTINVTGDTVIEPDEGFLVTLTNVSGTTLGSASGSIINDDTSLAISATDAVKPEGNSGNTPYVFTISRAGIITGATTVNYAVTGSGTNQATAADFNGLLPSGQVTFAANETNKTITINVSGDTAIEVDEEFTVTLSGATGGAQLLTAAATGTIQNDDASLAISALSASKAEGDTGTTSFTFTVTRTGASSITTSVNYAVSGTGTNPTVAADFGGTFPSGTVTFNPGDTSTVITLAVAGDLEIENDEDFLVTLSGATGGMPILTTTATGTIQNDDSSVSIVATDVNKSEGNTGATPFTFTITRNGMNNSPASVAYTVTGSGTNPANAADFGATPLTGVIDFAANETNKVLTLNVVGDTTVESNEGFTVTLSNNSGNLQFSPASASSTITDDDTSTLTISNVTLVEGSGGGSTAFKFDVTLSNSVAGGFNLPFTITGDTATLGADFTVPSTTPLQFAGTAGEVQSIMVQVIADTNLETDETFSVELGSITNLITGINASRITVPSTPAIGTITNDDTTSLTIGNVTKAEGSSANTTAYVFEVTLSNGLPAGFDIAFTIGGGTATAGEDYIVSTNSPLQFTGTAGEKQSITVQVTSDTNVELDETFLVTLGAISNLGGGLTANQISIAGSPATGTISNDDSAAISISDVTHLEGDAGQTAYVFTVTLSHAVDTPVSVNYTTEDGTANSGNNDYATTSGTLTFQPSGSLTQTITVQVNGDTTVEPDETFKVTLSGLTSGNPVRSVTIADAEGIGTIEADDGTLLSIADAQISEGDTGTKQLTFTITLSKPAATTFTIDYSTIDGSAAVTDSDFVSQQGTLTFDPSGPLTQQVTITINSDAKVERDEAFQIALSNLSTSAAEVTVNRGTATGTITNDDSATVSVNDVQTAEGDSGTKSLTFTVTLSQAVDVPVTVSYNTADGTALTSDNDYTATNGTLTFNPGDPLTRTVTVVVQGDALVEPDENMNLVLSNLVAGNPARSVTLGKSTGIGTITNDDAAAISIAATQQASEEATNGVFTLTTSRRFQTPVTLTLQISGTAEAGADYTTINSTIVFPANTDSITIPLTVLADKLIEGNETVTIKLLSADSFQGSIGSQDTATITITDNDSAQLSIETTKNISEGGSATTVLVTLITSDGLGGTATLAPGVTLTADVADVADGIATSGTDYAAFGTKTVTFGAGSVSGATASVTLVPNNDALVEGNETVHLRLQNLSSTLDGHAAISNANSTVTITDNDTASLSIQATKSITEQGGAQVILVTLTTSDGNGGTATLGPGVSLSADIVDAGGGTALSGTDYAAIGTKLATFAAGSAHGATVEITLTPTNDSLVEGSETMRLKLQNLVPTTAGVATLGNTDSVVTIQDNDTASIAIQNTKSITEQGGAQFVIVTLTTSDGAGGTATLAPGVTITADIVDAGAGTATSGTDYAAIGTKTVTFGAGSANGATANVTLTPTNDTLVEGNETLNLKLQNLAGAGGQVQLGNVDSVVTITDNDTAQVIIAATSSISEAGTSPTVAITLVASDGNGGTATLAPGVTLSVDVLDAGGGTATSGTDYAAFTTKTVTFAAGSAHGATQTVTLSPTNDTLVEGNETINLRIQNLSSTVNGQASLGNANGVVSITDNDTASLSIEAAKSFTEQGGAQIVIVTLTTSDGAGGTATLAPGISLTANVVDIAGATSTSGSDYVAIGTQTVTFAAGAGNGATANVTVNVTNDTLIEGNETINLRLQNPTPSGNSQITIGNGNSVITITDNDTARLAIAATANMTEAGGTQNIVVTLTTTDGGSGTATLAPGVTLTVDIVDAGGGTASSGNDYSVIGTKTVTFTGGAANGATQNVALAITNDKVVEGGETLKLKMQNPQSTLGSALSLGNVDNVATIQDNDTATIAIESTKTIFEQNGAQAVIVRLTTSDGEGGTATLGPGVTLSAQVVDAGGGSAASGTDYQTLATQTVTFSANDGNNATKTVTVTPISKAGLAADRTVNLRLQSLSGTLDGAASLGNTLSVVTISDAPPIAELRGYVFVDANSNGLRDSASEVGVAGVTVTLTGTDVVGGSVTLVVMTAEDGSYGFTNLRAGTYRIVETQPAAFLDGGESSSITGATVTNDSLANLVVETGAIVNDNNFAEHGYRAQYINARTFAASVMASGTQIRAVVAQGEDQAGNKEQATKIRNGSVASVVQANPSTTTTNNTSGGEGEANRTVATTANSQAANSTTKSSAVSNAAKAEGESSVSNSLQRRVNATASTQRAIASASTTSNSQITPPATKHLAAVDQVFGQKTAAAPFSANSAVVIESHNAPTREYLPELAGRSSSSSNLATTVDAPLSWNSESSLSGKGSPGMNLLRPQSADGSNVLHDDVEDDQSQHADDVAEIFADGFDPLDETF